MMTWSSGSISYRSRADVLLLGVGWASAIATVAVLAAIVVILAVESIPALRALGTSLLLDRAWHPMDGQFGIAPMIVGSLLVSIGAIAAAGPLGILCAVFLRYYAPRPLRAPFRRMLELLAGVPSVVLGFWGLMVIVPLLAAVQPPGTSLLAAVIVLAVMIMPTAALFADMSLARIPEAIRLNSAALGLSVDGYVWAVAVPLASRGIIAGLLLAAGRALGETMAVLMVAGNIVQVPRSLFEPFRAVTANIALEMAYATGTHRSALFASGLILVLLSLALVGFSLTGRRVARDA